MDLGGSTNHQDQDLSQIRCRWQRARFRRATRLTQESAGLKSRRRKLPRAPYKINRWRPWCAVSAECAKSSKIESAARLGRRRALLSAASHDLAISAALQINFVVCRKDRVRGANSPRTRIARSAPPERI